MKRTFTIKKIDKEVKNSSFLLTINTNIADPRIKEPLRKATNWMFENLLTCVFMFKFNLSFILAVVILWIIAIVVVFFVII
jgi:hypothetical protein